jgi:transcriptional regulator with XRE-family HTH domain
MLKLLNKLTVTELAGLSNFSKSYISQVKCGKGPPSQKLLDALADHAKPNQSEKDYLALQFPYLQENLRLSTA